MCVCVCVCFVWTCVCTVSGYASVRVCIVSGRFCFYFCVRNSWYIAGEAPTLKRPNQRGSSEVRRKTTNLYRPPTAEEMMEMREADSLYTSNLIKIQVCGGGLQTHVKLKGFPLETDHANSSHMITDGRAGPRSSCGLWEMQNHVGSSHPPGER